MPRRTVDPQGTKISVLIEEEKQGIETIKTNLGANLLTTDIGTQLDDLYILRFLLSHKSIEEAETSIRENIEWRSAHLEILKTISSGGKPPKHEIITRFMTFGFCGESKAGNPIFCARAGHSDPNSLMNSTDIESVALFLHFMSEKTFAKVNKNTRESGILTKSVFVLDLSDISILRANDKRYRNALSKGSKLNEAHYPQLLGKHVFINAPKMFSIMYQAVKVIMPKSSLEKHGFCPAKNTASGDASQCPFVSSIQAYDVLPKFLGGPADCPEDLVPPEDKVANKSLTSETIKAGGKITLDPIVVAQQGSSVAVELLIQNQAVVLFAMFTPAEKSKPPIELHQGGSGGQKISSSDGLTQFMWDIPCPGSLVVTFENPSRFRSKQLQHGFVVCEPPTQEVDNVDTTIVSDEIESQAATLSTLEISAAAVTENAEEVSFIKSKTTSTKPIDTSSVTIENE